ncbi:hypothetical protein CANARDRAFT_26067 [[Candida] arabinofermentans NRRL YB-2248]|uniref:Histone-binding protein RBBP4-like N-terminal domain-containing protein n=1 Tax=[Candida] arabinofermentans NRRL YB-2248 TaxID=983967 RepID=A0A1E4T7Z7_9ASCO|nr:hypothetical protein CANARDRAFT_26067 [[Candida] arabinofermentans NRRL YB-2248]
MTSVLNSDTKDSTTLDDPASLGAENLNLTEEEQTALQRQIKYKIWKTNAPILYDHIQTAPLTWPTLTVQWFPDVEEDPQRASFKQQRLLLGSYSTGFNKLESLQLYHVKIPSLEPDIDLYKDYTEMKSEFLANTSRVSGNTLGKLSLTQRIPHRSEINRARYMPQNPDLIATISDTGRAQIFDRTKKPNNFVESELLSSQVSNIFEVNDGRYEQVRETTEEDDPFSDISLNFHQSEGWGLDWNNFNEGQLVTGASDGLIAIWDLKQVHLSASSSTNDNPDDSITDIGISALHKAKKRVSTQMKPVLSYTAHDFGTNCVKFIPGHADLLGSVGEDGKFKLFDLRVSVAQQQSMGYKIGSAAINTLDFNGKIPFGFAVADEAGSIQVHDLRLLSKKTLLPVEAVTKAHEGPVTCVSWNHTYGSVLASGGTDGLVKLWDFGNEKSGSEDGDSRLRFVHGGHMLGVNDLDWNPSDPKMMVSCSDDNSIQVWKPAATIF